MRISDWSSDVCSSDLRLFGEGHGIAAERLRLAGRVAARKPPVFEVPHRGRRQVLEAAGRRDGGFQRKLRREIGRASGRERVCQVVLSSGVAVSSTKKTEVHRENVA